MQPKRSGGEGLFGFPGPNVVPSSNQQIVFKWINTNYIPLMTVYKHTHTDRMNCWCFWVSPDFSLIEFLLAPSYFIPVRPLNLRSPIAPAAAFTTSSKRVRRIYWHSAAAFVRYCPTSLDDWGEAMTFVGTEKQTRISVNGGRRGE